MPPCTAAAAADVIRVRVTASGYNLERLNLWLRYNDGSSSRSRSKSPPPPLLPRYMNSGFVLENPG